MLDAPLDEDDFKAITPDKKYSFLLYLYSHARQSKVVKHVEVVRKKSERDKLPGHECEHCQKVIIRLLIVIIQFYDAIDSDGKIFDRSKIVNECSRHKHLYSPPDTPENFWQVSFPSSETQE